MPAGHRTLGEGFIGSIWTSARPGPPCFALREHLCRQSASVRASSKALILIALPDGDVVPLRAL
jgi:hypothetical protein